MRALFHFFSFTVVLVATGLRSDVVASAAVDLLARPPARSRRLRRGCHRAATSFSRNDDGIRWGVVVSRGAQALFGVHRLTRAKRSMEWPSLAVALNAWPFGSAFD